MKIKLVLIISICSFCVFSQHKGKITYRVSLDKSEIEEPFENLENSEDKNNALALLQEAYPVEAYLLFKDHISLYYVEDKETPKFENIGGAISINPSGINFTWIMAGGGRYYYSDTNRDYYISTMNVMGNQKRLIGKEVNWTITEETKEIKGYLCKKAIMNSDENRYAWFTDAIPLKHGPQKFHGLPGLILEFYNNKHHFIIESIELNHPEVKDIFEPKEGELITQDELRKLAGNPFGNN